MTETGKTQDESQSSCVQKAWEILMGNTQDDGVGAPGWVRWWSKQLLISAMVVSLSLMPGVGVT